MGRYVQEVTWVQAASQVAMLLMLSTIGGAKLAWMAWIVTTKFKTCIKSRLNWSIPIITICSSGKGLASIG